MRRIKVTIPLSFNRRAQWRTSRKRLPLMAGNPDLPPLPLPLLLPLPLPLPLPQPSPLLPPSSLKNLPLLRPPRATPVTLS